MKWGPPDPDSPLHSSVGSVPSVVLDCLRTPLSRSPNRTTVQVVLSYAATGARAMEQDLQSNGCNGPPLGRVELLFQHVSLGSVDRLCLPIIVGGDDNGTLKGPVLQGSKWPTRRARTGIGGPQYASRCDGSSRPICIAD